MSATNFSPVLQAAILDRARKAIQALPIDAVTLNKEGKVDPKSLLSIERIRDDSNKAASGYEGIITRGSLKQLALEFTRLTDNASLATAATELLSAPNLFAAFGQYLTSENSGTKKYNSKEFTYTKYTTKSGTVKVGSNKSGMDSEQDFISLTDINHGDLKTLFIKFLRTYSTNEELVKYISTNIDSGHLTGVFNIRLQRLFNLNVSYGNKGYRDLIVNKNAIKEESVALSDAFTRILVLLSDADYLSSNIVHNIKLFSSTNKRVHEGKGTNPSVTTELQVSLLNQKAGRLLSNVGRQLNNIIIAVDRKKSRIDKNAEKHIQALFNSLKGVADYVMDLGATYSNQQLSPELQKTIGDILTDTKTIQKLIETEGSDSIVKAIGRTVASTIDGSKLPNRQVTNIRKESTAKLSGKGKGRLTTPKIVSKKYNIPTFPLPKVIRSSNSLVSLENLLRGSINEQVRKNMGSGNETKVLNYRTGRFSESVAIERLSESRQGMVTVFYNYMKNPYATFSDGGRQQYPKTRDPKLLISKSIREIAGPAVSNRLRSVVV